MRETSLAVSAERPGERPQRAQHPVGVDAGRVDGEGDHHDHGAQAEHRALGDRLGGDVDVAQHGPVPSRGEDRLAAVADQGVDDEIRSASARPIAARPARRGRRRRHSRRATVADPGGDQHERARVDEGDHGQRAEVGDRGARRCRLQRAAAAACRRAPASPDRHRDRRAPGLVATA